MFSIVAVKICFNLDFLTFTPQMKTAPKETRPQQRARSTRRGRGSGSIRAGPYLANGRAAKTNLDRHSQKMSRF